MPGVSKEQVAEARGIDLLSYLQTHEPQELVRSAPGEYRTASHGSLVISKNKWYWNRGGFGGVSALDYLIKVRGMGFMDAVETVGGVRAAPVYSPQPSRNLAPIQEPKTLVLPQPEKYPARLLSYLQGRGISADVIKLCLDDGILYEGRHGGPVCVFVGKDEAGRARFACMRGINGDMKKDCAGSDKRFSFKLAPYSPKCGDIAVFESPIDSLSHLCLFPENDAHRLSLGGTSAVALVRFLERHPQIRRVSLCLDADDAGQTTARRIQAALAEDERFSGLEATVQPPPVGKDYNDSLLHAIRQERQGKPPHRSKENSILA